MNNRLLSNNQRNLKSVLATATILLLLTFLEFRNLPNAAAQQTVQEPPAKATQETEETPSEKSSDSDSKSLGFSKTKPAEGPSVEVAGGFMIPYETAIPGTEVTFTMIPIPGGKFTMGSPESEGDRNDDEGPQFEVIVEPFWMGQYEVTWAEYTEFMNLYRSVQTLQSKGMRIVTADNKIDGVTAPSPLYKAEITYAEGDGPDEAAATMSQFSAKQYTKWLSRISGPFYRLPTEAEWEYACRAGTTTAYYFGDTIDDIDDHCWNYENSDELRQNVGVLKPNPWGLYDMSGNVAEWVLDQYDEDGYTHIKEGSTVTVDQAYRRPTKTFPRVVRGGSFDSSPEECRSASRLGSHVDWKTSDPNFPQSPWWLTDAPATGVGFRIIRPFKAPETIAEKNKYWDADLESIMDNVAARIESQGKGAHFNVDKNLVKDIEGLKKK